FLTGVSEAGGRYVKDPFTVGISEGAAENMFEDMLNSGMYDRQKVLKMKRDFWKNKVIGGVVARHPFIGQYSLQPLKFQLLKGVKDSVMTLPERSTNITIGGEEIPLNIGPLTGFAG